MNKPNILNNVMSTFSKYAALLKSNKRHQSAFAGILLGTGLSIYALVPSSVITIIGEPNSGFGHSISTADFNNDGIKDLVVTSPNTNTYTIKLLDREGNTTSSIERMYDNGILVDPKGNVPANSENSPATSPESQPTEAQVEGTEQVPPEQMVPQTIETPNTETPVPSVPALPEPLPLPTPPSENIETPPLTETPPVTPTEPTTWVPKASAQSLTQFGTYIAILPDMDANGTPDLLINDTTTSYIILLNTDLSPLSITPQIEYITHFENNTARYVNGEIFTTEITSGVIIKKDKITENTISMTSMNDYIAYGTIDNNINILHNNVTSTITDIQENSYGEKVPTYGSIIRLLPDMDNDGVPEIAIGYPVYDNGKGIVLVTLLSKNENVMITPKKTVAILNETNANGFGKTIGFSQNRSTDPFLFAIGADDMVVFPSIKELGVSKGKKIKAVLVSDGVLDLVFTENTGGSWFDDPTYEVAVQSDGKIVIGGHYSRSFNGVLSVNIARINQDGTPDILFRNNIGTGFDDRAVKSIKIQPDGKILIAGHFIVFNGQNQNYIVRLNSDGTSDASFNANTGVKFTDNNFHNGSGVEAIYLQPDGKIILGGYFILYDGVTTQYLMRLNNDGTPDLTFKSNLGTGFNLHGGIHSLAMQTDGKILVGGYFTDINGINSVRITRLNNDGTPDLLFNAATGSGFNDGVHAIAVQSDGKIIAGGYFTTYDGATSNRIIRLNSDGTKDNSFITNIGGGFNSAVAEIIVQPDGKIITGGYFTSFNGVSSNRIMRLNADGTPDVTFRTNISAGFDNEVESIGLQADGKIIAAGYFDKFDGIQNKKIMRLNSTGLPDLVFRNEIEHGFNGGVSSIVIQNDSKTIVGGNFTMFNNIVTNRIMRLNADGTPDSNYRVNNGIGFDGDITSLVIQNDGKVVAGGGFNSFNGTSANSIMRLNGDGTPDTVFRANIGTGFNGYVTSLDYQSDGGIIAVGDFTDFNGQAVNRIVRINSDGTLDLSFATNIGSGYNAYVSKVKVQTDGKIVASGFFTSFNGIGSNYIMRLNSDGTPDVTFRTNIGTGFDQSVNAIFEQIDGKLLIGGYFSTFNGGTSKYFTRLNLDATTDVLFNNAVGNNYFDGGIESILVQPDGQILAGGSFSVYANQTSTLKRGPSFIARFGFPVITPILPSTPTVQQSTETSASQTSPRLSNAARTEKMNLLKGRQINTIDEVLKEDPAPKAPEEELVKNSASSYSDSAIQSSYAQKSNRIVWQAVADSKINKFVWHFKGLPTITNWNNPTTKYKNIIKKVEVYSVEKEKLPRVLPNLETLQSYFSENKKEQAYFCNNINPLPEGKTWKRGEYKNKQVGYLEEFYGYILKNPINVDNDYGKYISLYTKIFEKHYQFQSPDEIFTNDNVEFIRGSILGCED